MGHYEKKLFPYVNNATINNKKRSEIVSDIIKKIKKNKNTALIKYTNELENNQDRQLFLHVTLDDSPEDEAFTRELDHLHWRLYGERASNVWASQTHALWEDVNANSGPAAAWKSVLVAMTTCLPLLFQTGAGLDRDRDQSNEGVKSELGGDTGGVW